MSGISETRISRPGYPGCISRPRYPGRISGLDIRAQAQISRPRYPGPYVWAQIFRPEHPGWISEMDIQYPGWMSRPGYSRLRAWISGLRYPAWISSPDIQAQLYPAQISGLDTWAGFLGWISWPRYIQSEITGPRYPGPDIQGWISGA